MHLQSAECQVRAKTSFTNNMAHDIRTPINGILACLRCLDKVEMMLAGKGLHE